MALFLAYLYGVRLSARVFEHPMWRPVTSSKTRTDEPEDADEAARPVIGPALRFAGLVAVMGLSGWVIAQVGRTFIEHSACARARSAR